MAATRDPARAPLDPTRLNTRLNNNGITPAASRNTTVLELAGELPAAVVAGLLAFSLPAACAWTTETGPNTAYAAALARRHPNTPSRATLWGQLSLR